MLTGRGGQLGAAIFFVVCLLLAGCAASRAANRCVLSVNTFAGPDAQWSLGYVVLPLNPAVQATDKDFVEYSAYLKRALDARGYHAATLENADIAVFLGYGVGRPEDHISFYRLPEDRSPPDPSSIPMPPNAQPPAPDGDGLFTRFAIINAVDVVQYRTENRLFRVWSTKIVSVGESSDLRAMFPIILAGAWDLLGKGSPEMVRREVDVDGREVRWMKSPAATRATSAQMLGAN
jgi:hypothetical protein